MIGDQTDKLTPIYLRWRNTYSEQSLDLEKQRKTHHVCRSCNGEVCKNSQHKTCRPTNNSQIVVLFIATLSKQGGANNLQAPEEHDHVLAKQMYLDHQAVTGRSGGANNLQAPEEHDHVLAKQMYLDHQAVTGRSDNKRYVKEQKKLLEREDHQVKNVLSLCMRTIREMKSGPMQMFSGVMNSELPPQGAPNGPVSLPQVVADTDNSSSGSEQDTRYELARPSEKYVNSRSRQFSRYSSQSRSMMCSTPVSARAKKPLLSFDIGTQVDFDAETRKQKMEEMAAVVKGLYSRFLALVAQLERRNMPLPASAAEFLNEQQRMLMPEPEQNGTRSPPVQNAATESPNVNGHDVKGDVSSNPKTLEVRRVSAHTTNAAAGEPNYGQSYGQYGLDYDTVPIGSGHTVVPTRLLNEIDWASYTNATRQLLQAVFPRRVLATHSLTGKQSPAFLNIPPKKRLDPQVVNDIVDTVATRCGVSKRLVRGSITIKCTDEAKLYRNRLHYRQARQNQNQENVPPGPSSDSSIVTD